MAETAINVPFESSEIIHIVAEELQARMRQLSPLYGSKEYSAFSVHFLVKIRLRRAGEEITVGKDTLAWGSVAKGDSTFTADVSDTVDGSFESRDPNEERVARDMPLTLEVGDGRGGKIRKKGRVKA